MYTQQWYFSQILCIENYFLLKQSFSRRCTPTYTRTIFHSATASISHTSWLQKTHTNVEPKSFVNKTISRCASTKLICCMSHLSFWFISKAPIQTYNPYIHPSTKVISLLFCCIRQYLIKIILMQRKWRSKLCYYILVDPLIDRLGGLYSVRFASSRCCP